MRIRENRCRVCKGILFFEPLIQLAGVPNGAQSFLNVENLQEDQGENLVIYQCSQCGLVQINGSPIDYYREVIRATAFSQEMQNFRKKQLTEWIQKYGLYGKNVIEIGCGHGEYLQLLKAAGIQITGFEYRKSAIHDCQKKGFVVHRGYLSSVTQHIKGAPYDAFATFNFIEHWPAPVTTLCAIGNNLVPQGIGIVEAPNFDMILQKSLFSEFIRDHLSYFSSETLVFTLNLGGFEILECKPIWHDYILSAVVRKRSPLNFHDFNVHRIMLTKELQNFISSVSPKKVAIWGAGHQALAVIALTGIASQIRYIIDSAPFKQGKYSPATHLKIVSPETLLTDPVESVIIMAASYSDEIVHILRNQFEKDLRIAVLREQKLEIL